jgi:hypothetical protein
MSRVILVFISAAGMSACATTTPPPTAVRCDAAPAQAYVGQIASQDIGARMLAATGASALRWVGFGQMVTMEFREGRLTVHLDAQGKVASAACT